MKDQLTDKQLRILRHMLGINKPNVRAPKPYRNYYCAGKGDEELAALERTGAVECYCRDEEYDWYRCTEAGKAAAIASHKDIRVPKKKRVYCRYLDTSEAIPGLTFKEFLTSDRFADIRAEA